LLESTQYNHALELCVSIYQLTSTFPVEEIDGLSRQLRQTVISLAARTAPDAEQKSAARGLLLEIEIMLVVAERLGFAASKKIAEIKNLSEKIAEKLADLNPSAETTSRSDADTDKLPKRSPVGGIITPQ
jgi:four helix bundle protein